MIMQISPSSLSESIALLQPEMKSEGTLQPIVAKAAQKGAFQDNCHCLFPAAVALKHTPRRPSGCACA
jgi:hypothetical protein